MEQIKTLSTEKLTKHFLNPVNPIRLIVSIIVITGLLGIFSGFSMSKKAGTSGGTLNSLGSTGSPKTAQQDNTTFRDFAEGTLKAKPQSKNGQYSEGTHVLERADAVPVTLTSSVVDLSQYEGKHIKVFGETQKALSAGWLMDVGKVEEAK